MVDDKKREFYELEKILAQRIRNAPRADRVKVTMDAYNELLRRVPWHPMLNENPEQIEQAVLIRTRAYGPLLRSSDEVLEIGCGRGAVAKRLADTVALVVGLDVSEEIMPDPTESKPANVEFVIGDACELIQGRSFDVVLSCQLLEHLHPEDVATHLRAVRGLLKSGGRYIIDTPSSLTGPHDVSKYFDKIATGFHLKEWTYRELAKELAAAGYRTAKVQLLPNRLSDRSKSWYRFGLRPIGYKVALEVLVGLLPRCGLRTKLANAMKLGAIFIVAYAD
jgi:2-polyprenyl-3-methyl-5-hydroxy-6-metoxy-1,4-benzoquinol methylase